MTLDHMIEVCRKTDRLNVIWAAHLPCVGGELKRWRPRAPGFADPGTDLKTHDRLAKRSEAGDPDARSKAQEKWKVDLN